MEDSPPSAHGLKTEPKFARCRLCHEHFYADTLAEARRACLEHARLQHPDWSESVCYCPD